MGVAGPHGVDLDVRPARCHELLVDEAAVPVGAEGEGVRTITFTSPNHGEGAGVSGEVRGGKLGGSMP